MKQVLKVGQRVKVNGGIKGTDGRFNGLNGTIMMADWDATIFVQFDWQKDGEGYWVFANRKKEFDVEILEDVQTPEV